MFEAGEKRGAGRLFPCHPVHDLAELPRLAAHEERNERTNERGSLLQSAAVSASHYD